MIIRNMRLYDYYTYGAPNTYGQPVLSEEVQGTVKMAIHITSQSVQDNINYQDCSYIGLTFDKTITDAHVIKYGEEKLKVLYVNPLGKIIQVYLKRI